MAFLRAHAIAGVCAALIGSVVAETGDLGGSYCINNLNDNFFNRCFIQYPTGFLTVLAGVIQQWVNPRFLAQAAIVAVLLLPFLFVGFGFSLSSDNLRKYRAARLSLLNFLHRVGFTLILDVALYAAFRQERPCLCPTASGGYARVGSLYGMPSGDAMSGAVFGAWIIEKGPVHRIWGRVVGVLVVIWVCFERVVLGYHTVGQVTTGAAIGIAVHLYSTSVPQFMILGDSAIQLVSGLFLLFFDPALQFAMDDMNNLFSWFFWGLAIQTFTVIVLVRHFYADGLSGLRRTYRYLAQKAESGESDSLLLNEPASGIETEPTEALSRLDTMWLWIAFAACVAVILFSVVIQHYSFMQGV